VTIETQQPLPLQPYADNRVDGTLIVVDPISNRTRGALLVERAKV
jgi:sulfate adenylyltransferase subunit 1